MSPLILGIICFLFALFVSLGLLVVFHPRRPRWKTIGYACHKKSILGFVGSNELIAISLEIDDISGEERAWATELVSGERNRMDPEKAKELLASFTQAHTE